jgi:hypothetical protein
MTKQQEDEIRNYAHQLWEKAGRPEGRSEEFWRLAQIELDAEGEASDTPDQPNANIIPG